VLYNDPNNSENHSDRVPEGLLMNDFLLTVIGFLIVLGPLILIHELGHFLAARMIGVTVLEFGLGFPPRALRLFEQGGTEFTLNWLPIGGFVRPLGEDFVKPLDEKATEADRAAFERYQEELAALGRKQVKVKSLMEANPWQRMFFMVNGALFNFIGAFLILILAGMLGRPAPGVIVIDPAFGSPADDAELQFRDIITTIDGTPVTQLEEAQTLLSEKGRGESVTLTIVRGSETFDVTLPETQVRFNTAGILIQAVEEGSPAAEVLQADDIVIEIDGQAVTDVTALREYVDTRRGQTVSLTFLRAGEERTAEIVPRTDPPAGQGPLGVSIVGLTYDVRYGLSLGIGQGADIEYLSFSDSVNQAANTTGSLIGQIVSLPAQLINRTLSPEEGRFVSPVGIAQASGTVLSATLEDRTPFRLLNFLAVISIALGVTNLLPVPGLDGGRILFVIIEIIRGKPIPPELEGRVHLIGLMLLLGLVAVLVVQDVVNPIDWSILGQ
jgi:regulator of sigma E protease